MDPKQAVERVRRHSEALFREACAAETLTTVGQQLWELAREGYPGHQLIYDPEPLEEFLRWEAVNGRSRPLCLFKDGLEMVPALALSGIDGSNDDPEFEWVARAANEASWFVNLALKTNVKGNACLRHLAQSGQATAAFLSEIYTRLEPVRVCCCERDAFLKASFAAASLRWLFFVQGPPDAEPVVIDATENTENVISASPFEHRATWELQHEGVFPLTIARRLAQSVFNTAWPFSGPGGKVVVVSFNDPNSLPVLQQANELVKDKHTKGIGHTLNSRIVSETQGRKRSREHIVLTMFNRGVRDVPTIAEELVAAGFSTPASADREVRMILPADRRSAAPTKRKKKQ